MKLQDSLLIRDIRFFKAILEDSILIEDSTHSIPKIAFYIAEIELENGIKGQGYMLGFHYFPKAIQGALADIRDFITQFKVYEIKRMTVDFDKESEYLGKTGLLKWIQSVVNVAMWDAWGKVNQQPIWKLLGACHKNIPIYGSGGWLSYSDEELLDEVLAYKARGYRAVKIKIGSSEEGRDIHRVKIVREALGPDFKIMLDANQGMNVNSIIYLLERISDLDIFLLEEPITHTNYSGYEMIRLKTTIALAMGEREYDFESLKSLIARNAIDYWQPDIIRIGGVEGWLQSASLANSYHLKVLPHFYKDYDVPLLCTIPNSYGAESFDWIDKLIDNQMEIKEGLALPRKGVGWGFNFLYEKMSQI